MKNSAIKIKGQWRDVYKDPVTDQGKRSKKGILDLQHGKTVRIQPAQLFSERQESQLQVVYRNGQLINRIQFQQVRDNTAKNLLVDS